ncbi:hypothetical protein KSS87_017768 [Heliosperma pusillum]|nr:hypothetical protein KSS87_017768 [Heliosperma pusillum]
MSPEDACNESLNQTTSSPYEEAMNALSSLITTRSRAEKSNSGDRFDLLYDYVKILDLEEPISKLKVIHVAGTKGKEKVTDDIPMPTYFRFLALLAFKIFSAEQVDVAIMEVGLGGRYDATNVVEAPVVCGISSLGYDHMEILGNTLGQIAGEKAGIFKERIPAFTVPQPEEAMCVLKQNSSKLNVNLQVASPLDPNLLNGLRLGLGGDHQLVNAGLAVALCSSWLQRTGHLDVPYHISSSSLPEQFIKGLATASFQGRAQIVSDQYIGAEGSEDLVFYLDGAHSPESMEVCAKWFFHAIKEDEQRGSAIDHRSSVNSHLSLDIALQLYVSEGSPVASAKALFVPNVSVYNKVMSKVPQPDKQIDISWQLTLQRVWESLVKAEKGGQDKSANMSFEEARGSKEQGIINGPNSKVFPTLPLAIKWLRDNVRQNQSTRLQVMPVAAARKPRNILSENVVFRQCAPMHYPNSNSRYSMTSNSITDSFLLALQSAGTERNGIQ